MRFASTPSPAPQTPQGRNLIYAQGLPAGTYGPKYLYGVGAFQTLRILHQGPQAGLVVTILWDDDTASTWDTHSDVYTFTADANGNSYLDVCVPVRGTNATIQLDNCTAGGLLQVSGFTGYHAPFASQYSATSGFRTAPGGDILIPFPAGAGNVALIPVQLPTWSGIITYAIIIQTTGATPTLYFQDASTPPTRSIWAAAGAPVSVGGAAQYAFSGSFRAPRHPLQVTIFTPAAGTAACNLGLSFSGSEDS